MNRPYWYIIAITFVISAAFGIYLFHVSRPETLASSPDGICKFFDIKLKYRCTEKMYNQSDDCVGFGSNVFYLQCDSAFVESNLNHLRSLADVVSSDSTISISKRRGDIEGVLTIYLKHPRCPKYYAIASYKKVSESEK